MYSWRTIAIGKNKNRNSPQTTGKSGAVAGFLLYLLSSTVATAPFLPLPVRSGFLTGSLFLAGAAVHTSTVHQNTAIERAVSFIDKRLKVLASQGLSTAFAFQEFGFPISNTVNPFAINHHYYLTAVLTYERPVNSNYIQLTAKQMQTILLSNICSCLWKTESRAMEAQNCATYRP